MKIFIVAPYCSLPNEPYFNRFLYLAELLSKNHDVILITSKFRHYDKKIRDGDNIIQKSYKIILLEEPGYKKNVSFARLWSHYIFVKNFRGWFLENVNKENVDIVYSAYPLIETNIFLGSIKKELSFKLILDIQDIWPESFSAVMPFLDKLPYHIYPFYSKANKAYSSADALIAVSRTYLQRAMKINSSVPNEVVYIGTNAKKIYQIQAKMFDKDRVHLFYLGTISYSYDMRTVCEGIKQLLIQGEKIQLHILGGGPELEKLKCYESDFIKFYGYLPYEEMVSIAKGCDIAINPIHSYAKQSITNKLSDYIVLEKPIINSQRNNEVKEILKLWTYADYVSGNIESFKKAVRYFLYGAKEKKYFSKELIKCFDREIAYNRILKLIERLSNE